MLTVLLLNSYKAGNATNMAVMEVALPSGYTADVDALPAISRAKEVKRIDTSDGDTNVIIYFDRVRTALRSMQMIIVRFHVDHP